MWHSEMFLARHIILSCTHQPRPRRSNWDLVLSILFWQLLRVFWPYARDRKRRRGLRQEGRKDFGWCWDLITIATASLRQQGAGSKLRNSAFPIRWRPSHMQMVSKSVSRRRSASPLTEPRLAPSGRDGGSSECARRRASCTAWKTMLLRALLRACSSRFMSSLGETIRGRRKSCAKVVIK